MKQWYLLTIRFYKIPWGFFFFLLLILDAFFFYLKKIMFHHSVLMRWSWKISINLFFSFFLVTTTTNWMLTSFECNIQWNWTKTKYPSLNHEQNPEILNWKIEKREWERERKRKEGSWCSVFSFSLLSGFFCSSLFQVTFIFHHLRFHKSYLEQTGTKKTGQKWKWKTKKKLSSIFYIHRVVYFHIYETFAVVPNETHNTNILYYTIELEKKLNFFFCFVCLK